MVTDSIPLRESLSRNFSVDIILDNVICRGEEDNLFQCAHNGIGVHDCDNTMAAGVICGGTSICIKCQNIKLLS